MSHPLDGYTVSVTRVRFGVAFDHNQFALCFTIEDSDAKPGEFRLYSESLPAEGHPYDRNERRRHTDATARTLASVKRRAQGIAGCAISWQRAEKQRTWKSRNGWEIREERGNWRTAGSPIYRVYLRGIYIGYQTSAYKAAQDIRARQELKVAKREAADTVGVAHRAWEAHTRECEGTNGRVCKRIWNGDLSPNCQKGKSLAEHANDSWNEYVEAFFAESKNIAPAA